MTDPDRLLAALDERQKEVAETLRGPLCVLAGAGTGKTRAITHRIAYGVATGTYDPRRVMALTFTTRAAGELLGRLRALGADGVQARTFHSAALRQLHYFWPVVAGGSPPRILDGKGALLGHAASALKLRLDTAALRDSAAEIEWRKVSRLSLEQYAHAAPSRALPAQLSVDAMIALQQRYEDLKDERKQIDFEDVLLATAGMIECEPRVAEQVREQYRFFVVDEYQDVSPLQHDLLSLWLGGRRELCVVGDASQTIYSFAGATSDYLVRFGSEYPEATVVRLEDNYRSTAPIVTLANRLMPRAISAAPLTLRARGDRIGRAERRAPTPRGRLTLDRLPQRPRVIAQSIAQRLARRPRRPRSSHPCSKTASTLSRSLLTPLGVPRCDASRCPCSPVRTVDSSDQQEVKQAILLLRGCLRVDRRRAPVQERERRGCAASAGGRIPPRAVVRNRVAWGGA